MKFSAILPLSITAFLISAVSAEVAEFSAAEQATSKDPLYAPIPGPKIISTKTSVANQQENRVRPEYHQPKPLKGKPTPTRLPLQLEKGESLVFLGNSLPERMLFYNHFEPLLHANFPDKSITFRNMGFPGHTPAFRPEAGTSNPWAFPGAEKFRPDIKKHLGVGHYPHPDEWLTILQADTIVAFFGFNESFDGAAGVNNYRNELGAFVDHTLSRSYNQEHAPRLILVTPISTDLPERNEVLSLYAQATREVAAVKNVGLVDLFSPTSGWKNLTINGVHLGEKGYKKLAPLLFEKLFQKTPSQTPSSALREAVADKTWHWRSDYRIINGVHVYGQRWTPFGNINYPEEIEKVRQLTVLRDQKVWQTAQGKSFNPDDASTRSLTKIKTNYRQSAKNGTLDYLGGDEALEKMTTPEGFEVSTFATEKDFPHLGNPMQMRFDNRGRLWVATMPSYPHYRPGDPKPDDKILIYEDTDQDGRADREIVWADGLSLPIGFDFTTVPGGGIYLTSGSRLLLLQDRDEDDRADHREYLLDGFDTHDSHHAFSAFDTDHGGGLFMLEGRFLHSQIETPFGPRRMTDGGVWRYDPHSGAVERVMQTDVSNPWGITFDEYGQNILNDASGGKHYWMGTHSIKMGHAREMSKVGRINWQHRARPTSGSEIISSSHFPDRTQGDYLYGNTIGVRGIIQLSLEDDGPAKRGNLVHELVSSSDGNFRPADLEFAPDGSLYFLDWHNTLIGHMQHSARDPNRSGKYGRIYRITYPSRPLVETPKIHGAPIAQLFENFKLPELQTRKRSHRELRSRPANEVLPFAIRFAQENATDERLVLESLWATWGQGQPSLDLLKKCLTAKDLSVRAAAVRVLRHNLSTFEKNASSLLLSAAQDEHPRVRMEALSAASWLGGSDGSRILLTVASQPRGRWINNALNCAMELLDSEVRKTLENQKFNIPDLDLLLKRQLEGQKKETDHLTASQRDRKKTDPNFRDSYKRGLEVYNLEGSCKTCHQPDGQGLRKIYPPLANSIWVTGNAERLTKLTLHGLWGKIVVNGGTYDPADGVPPMTAVGAMLTDQQVADVLTYVRNSWGNVGSALSAKEIGEIRAATKDQKTFYTPEQLLEEHPFPEGTQ